MSALKTELSEKIKALEGVSQAVFDGKNGEFVSFLYKNKEFAHFHGDKIIDLRLTKKVIASEGLQHPQESTNHPTRSPKSPWIELEFTNKKQMQAVFAYVKLALEQIK